MNPTTAIVTGASSGIGKELARIAAADGFNVILTARDKAALVELKHELAQLFPEQKFIVIAADLAKPGVAAKLYKTVAKKYDVELLINNAGFGDYGPVVGANSDTLEDMIQLNIASLTELTRLAAKDMASRQAGHILNVGSMASFFPGPYMAVYHATKAYVLSFTEAVAEELKGSNVVITALCPGPTQTNFDEQAHTKGKGVFKKYDTLPTAREVAEFGYNSLVGRKVVAVHGRRNRMGVFVARFLPRSVIRRILQKQLRR